MALADLREWIATMDVTVSCARCAVRSAQCGLGRRTWERIDNFPQVVEGARTETRGNRKVERHFARNHVLSFSGTMVQFPRFDRQDDI